MEECNVSMFCLCSEPCSIPKTARRASVAFCRQCRSASDCAVNTQSHLKSTLSDDEMFSKVSLSCQIQVFPIGLTRYRTIPTFNDLKKSDEIIVIKWENAGNHFLTLS